MMHALAKLRSARGQADHDYRKVFLKAQREIEGMQCIDIPEAKTLVVGCGYLYPDVTLWSAVASHAVGVDVRRTFLRNSFGALYRDFRRSGNGPLKALMRSSVIRVSWSPYYNYLRRSSGVEIHERSQDLVVYDGKRLPFADRTFDIVCSNAVLEHVADPDKMSDELHRVTRPGGVGYHIWHNYYSLSGGHVPDSLAISSPWGHLLGDPRVEEWLRFTGTYLNEKLPDAIVESLSRNFVKHRVDQLDANHRSKDADAGYEPEGVEFLTPALEERLSKYPREILLTRAYSFIGMRK